MSRSKWERIRKINPPETKLRTIKTQKRSIGIQKPLGCFMLVMHSVISRPNPDEAPVITDKAWMGLAALIPQDSTRTVAHGTEMLGVAQDLEILLVFEWGQFGR